VDSGAASLQMALMARSEDRTSDTSFLAVTRSPPTALTDAYNSLHSSVSHSAASPRSPIQVNPAENPISASTSASPLQNEVDVSSPLLWIGSPIPQPADSIRSSSGFAFEPTRPTSAIHTTDQDTAIRYPLRRRDPRQVNPYMHDRLVYKYQLRQIPEAIVHRPDLQHHSSHSHPPTVDPDYEEQQPIGGSSREARATSALTPPPGLARAVGSHGGAVSPILDVEFTTAFSSALKYRKPRRRRPRKFPMPLPSPSAQYGRSHTPSPDRQRVGINSSWRESLFQDLSSDDEELGSIQPPLTIGSVHYDASNEASAHRGF
jgi:hypothetical protein